MNPPTLEQDIYAWRAPRRRSYAGCSMKGGRQYEKSVFGYLRRRDELMEVAWPTLDDLDWFASLGGRVNAAPRGLRPLVALVDPPEFYPEVYTRSGPPRIRPEPGPKLHACEGREFSPEAFRAYFTKIGAYPPPAPERPERTLMDQIMPSAEAVDVKRVARLKRAAERKAERRRVASIWADEPPVAPTRAIHQCGCCFRTIDNFNPRLPPWCAECWNEHLDQRAKEPTTWYAVHRELCPFYDLP